MRRCCLSKDLGGEGRSYWGVGGSKNSPGRGTGRCKGPGGRCGASEDQQGGLCVWSQVSEGRRHGDEVREVTAILVLSQMGARAGL